MRYSKRLTRMLSEGVAGKGVDATTASLKGRATPLDPNLVEGHKDIPSSSAFLAQQAILWGNKATVRTFLGHADGGHGPMFDLVGDDDSIALMKEFVAASKPISAVFHNPIVFISVIPRFEAGV
ncbi:hypothetical protein Hte_004459 [Hypoxylon texense]